MLRWESTSQVWCVCGNLGGGKTLTAVSMIYDGLSRGWYVCTNIELELVRLSACLGFDCSRLVQYVDLEKDDPLQWPSGSPRGSGGGKRVLVVLDEVAEWFDQYSSTSPSVKRFLSWLRHTSKRSQDVIMVVQRREYLAKSLRILVARWVWCEDLAVWRIPVLRIRIPFCGGFVMRSVSDRLGNILQYLELVSKVRYGQFYHTAQCLVSGAGQAEEYAPIFRQERYFTAVEIAKILLPVCLACFLALRWRGGAEGYRLAIGAPEMEESRGHGFSGFLRSVFERRGVKW